MISWALDKDRRIYPPHYRRAFNYSAALLSLCDQYSSRLSEYAVSDLLEDRINSLVKLSGRKKKMPKIISKTDHLDIETATQTIISLVAVSPMANSLILLLEDADTLSQRFQCTTINNEENRIFGQVLGANRLMSEYVFRD